MRTYPKKEAMKWARWLARQCGPQWRPVIWCGDAAPRGQWWWRAETPTKSLQLYPWFEPGGGFPQQYRVYMGIGNWPEYFRVGEGKTAAKALRQAKRAQERRLKQEEALAIDLRNAVRLLPRKGRS